MYRPSRLRMQDSPVGLLVVVEGTALVFVTAIPVYHNIAAQCVLGVGARRLLLSRRPQLSS